jgi:hypothetical protein
VGPPDEAEGRLRFEPRFYDQTCRDLRADVIVCRHVIEHIADPIALLNLVRGTVDGTGATLFFETPCVEWILSNDVIWDLFYEHCSYFTAASLRTVFERSGFAVRSVENVFGGQYLWLNATPADTPVALRLEPGRIPALARHFAETEAAHVLALRLRLEQLGSTGGVALWGAAAKGVTLANLVDPDRRLLACVVDLNPNKQGGYLPGTGHPIVAPDDLRRWKVETAIVMNPNYVDENARLLEQAGVHVRLVDLMNTGEVDAHSH